jgi:hypothetical protein
MSGVATAVVAGAVISGVAANSAAKKQAGAAGRAAAESAAVTRETNALNERIFNQQRRDQLPWIQQGTKAIGQLGAGVAPGGEFTKNFTMSDYEQDPGYQFRQAEGEKSINRAAASAGRFNSGRSFKDLMRFNQGLASDEYGNAFNRFQINQGNRFNRLASVAGVGQQAVNAIGQAGQSYAGAVGAANMNNANNITANIIGAGNAAAASRVAQGTAANNAIGQGINYYQGNQLLNRIGAK